MTNPTSYAFFDCNRTHLPPRLMYKSELVLRISVDEGRIAIQLNSVLNDDDGVVSEQLEEERVITLHVNDSGDKYIRAVGKDYKGRESEWAFDVSRSWVANEKIGMNSEAKTLVNDAVGEWLGLKSKNYLLGKNSPWAFYPALRSLPVWKQIESGDWHAERTVMSFMASLTMVACRTERIADALRDNSNWEAFISDITKERRDATNTLALVSQCVLEEPRLLEFAALDTGIPFSKLWREEKEAVQAYGESFAAFDKHAIHLMLQFLPEDAKAEATKMILVTLKEWNKVRVRQTKFRQAASSFISPFNRVPEKLKSSLAFKLFESLQKCSSTMQDILVGYYKTPTACVPTSFVGAYNEWFYELVFQPSIVSDASSNDVLKLHKVLFGVECSELQFPELDFYETDRQTTFCHLKWRFDTVQEAQAPLVFANIAPLLSAFPESKENSTAYNEYVDAEGYHGMMPKGTLYSLDDMITALKLGAEVIDIALHKLGRETSPENRYSYLTMSDPHRNYENTWFYYDLGVTEVGKITALKEAGITDVGEILTYAQLPDEMFYEIIGLQLQH